MATEILVNDGGAPARILPFSAGEAISAGEVLKASTSAAMTAVLATSGENPIIGVALTDAASGELCSVVSGRGIIVMAQATDEAAGAMLMVDGTPGQLDLKSGNTDEVVAIALENNDGAGLTKVMLV